MRYNYSMILDEHKKIKTEITEGFIYPTNKKYVNIKKEYISSVELDTLNTRKCYDVEDESYTLEYFTKQLRNIKSGNFTPKYNNILDECLNEINYRFKNNIWSFVFMVVHTED